MTNRELRVAAVEIARFAGLNVRRADGEPRRAAVNGREIHEIAQSRFERLSGIIPRRVNRQWNMKSEKGQRIWFEET